MHDAKPPMRSAFDRRFGPWLGPWQGRLQLLPSRKNLSIALALAIGLAIGLAIVLGAFAIATVPPSLQVSGYAGHLGEWELTAALSKIAPARMRELSGPLTMKHIGLCSQDGPEEKTGAMRLRLSLLSSSVEARLSIEGVECTYRGSISDAHTGMLVCPDRRAVPLTLWIK
jgi:hypothetical protein